MATLQKVLKGPNEILPFDHPAICYPQLASTKFDGFRCLNLCGEQLLSPALKEIPNKHLKYHLAEMLTFCRENRIVTDGEIWSPELTFQELQSIIRSFDKPIPSHVKYYLFDSMTESQWDSGSEHVFLHRYMCYRDTFMERFNNVVPVEQYHINNPFEAQEFFENQLEQGHEGMILRQPNAKYKHGRTTPNQDGLWKFKEFVTHDARIFAVEEQMKLKAGVERTRDALGHLERRYEQDLYEPAGMAGALVVDWNNTQFKVKPGRGYDNRAKELLWLMRFELVGKHCEFRYMPHGSKDNPRIGSLVRMRPDLD